VVVSGPSGAGKGTVVRELLRRRPDVVLSVSATTRPARRGERNGVDYHFVSEREFSRIRDAGEFLEWAKVYDNYYGTPRAPVEAARAAGRDVLAELDIQGALAMKRSRPDATLVFIEPPSLDELFLRLRGRGTENPATMSQRLRAAYDEVKRKGVYDHLIVNDDLDDAVQALVRILEDG
jgi:guanylate kinase